jgi:competence protein ComEA
VDALTPAERRGALVVVVLLALGAGHDLWRASRPLPAAQEASRTGLTRPPDARGDTIAPESTSRALAGPEAHGAVDLNRASARELDALPGIGPVLAARIIAHRQRHGPFASRDELLAVRGIGPRLLTRLGPYIRAGKDVPPAPPDTIPAAP